MSAYWGTMALLLVTSVGTVAGAVVGDWVVFGVAFFCALMTAMGLGVIIASIRAPKAGSSK
jgi:hypothetical protein